MGMTNSLYLGFILVLTGYLVGSIPFGYFIVKTFYRKDIRELGSKNPGATNVWRCFGKWPGMATLALDILKGLFPVLITRRLLGQDIWPLIVGIVAIGGHNWSLFLRGKGGKGVATSAGVFLAILPRECAIALAAFLVVLLISRRVSIGSMGAAVVFVVSSFFFPKPFYFHLMAIAASLMILVKHIPNLKRLIQGQEPSVRIS